MQPLIRNVAIIAHVDHGKTTLVDALLKQSHIFRENQQVGELIMDRNDLEREKGITILAKNTAITYRGVKINIIDTPGHADFSSEVERVLNMADSCLLVVDAVDGPMPQTRFVLQHALRLGLQPIVVINKIDRPSARPTEVVAMIEDLFLDLATSPGQLDYPVLYASAKAGYALASLGDTPGSVAPLLDAILAYTPPPSGDPARGLQMLVAALDYDSHLGQLAIGRITRGTITRDETVARLDRDGHVTLHHITSLYVFQGLSRQEVHRASAGEIVALAGVEPVAISDTIASAEHPEALPAIAIDEPTVQTTVGVNTSPFAGREGRYLTSRQLRDRLLAELQTNVGLRVEDTESPDVFLVSGRGELHLAILIETLRREGYELQVSKPRARVKTVNGQRMEPYERLTLEVDEDAIGTVTESLSARLAQMIQVHHDGRGRVRLEFHIPTRGLIGFRSFFLKATRGTGVMSSVFTEFEPLRGEVKPMRTGALIASEPGTAVTYGLNNAQQRGATLIEPGAPVYEGMIVGLNSRNGDLAVNVCKEKKLTNIRSSTADVSIKLTPPLRLSLEEALDFIAEDEVVEVTTQSIRLRKRVLAADDRYRQSRSVFR